MPRGAKSPDHADAESLGPPVEMARVGRRQAALRDPVARLPPGDPRREDAWLRIMAMEPQWRAAVHAASVIPARTWGGLRAKARAVRVMVPSPRAGFPASAFSAPLRSVLDDVPGEADDGRARPAHADMPDPGREGKEQMAEIEAACDPEVERRKDHPVWPECEPFPLTPLEAWYVMQGWEVEPARVHHGRFPGDPALYAVAFLPWRHDPSGNAADQMAVVVKTPPDGAWAPVGIAPRTAGTEPRDLRFSGRTITYTGTVVGPGDGRVAPKDAAPFRLEVGNEGVRFVEPSAGPGPPGFPPKPWPGAPGERGRKRGAAPGRAVTGAGASEADVLVFGADPAGLLLALELRRRGVARVRVARPLDASTPLPVPLLLDAATTGALAELGLAGVLHDAGAVPLARVLVARRPPGPGRGRRAAPGEAAFASHAGPGPLVVGRAELCEALRARLAAFGVTVEPMTDLGAVAQEGDGVNALLVHHLGDTREIVRARWLVWTFYASYPLMALIGLAYAPASVRDGIEQSGLVRLPAPQPAGTAHLWTDGRGYAAVLPLGDRLAHVELSLPGVGREGTEARAWPTLRAALGRAAGVRWAGLRPGLDASYPGGVGPLPRLREGRVLLAGAAAHGAAWGAAGPAAVNAELGDVLTLAPRLAAVLAGEAPGGALDGWAHERRAAVLRAPWLLGVERARALADGRLEDAGALVLGHRAVPTRDTDGAGARWHLVPPDAGGAGAP